MSLAPYRKLIVYIGMAVLVILNEFLGFQLDEQAYTEALKETVNMIIMVAGGVGVYQARNEPL